MGNTYTAEDLAYVALHFVPLEELCRSRGHTVSEVDARIAAGTLPQPPHTLAAGKRMVPRNYFALADEAGPAQNHRQHFLQRYLSAMREYCMPADEARAEEEFAAYLGGGYAMCLIEPSPETIARKAWLMSTIEYLVSHAAPDDAAWLERLHEHVDALDRLELPFCDYDRRHFGGPVSRDRLITAMRVRFPRAARTREMSPR